MRRSSKFTPSIKVRSGSTFVDRRKKEEPDNSDDLIAELFDAISDGNTKLVDLILKDAKKPQNLLKRKDPQGLTPLKKAVTLNKGDIARLLVKSGASPDVRDPLGKAPIHIAVMQGRRELLAPLLVSVDSSVNVQDKEGWTPLHYAIRGKHLKVIEWLLFAGADVNLKNKDDLSALDVTEEDSLMRKMLTAFDVDRDIYPVILSSAFISKKDLNYIGTDGQLMFVTTSDWSANEQFLFCKQIRPAEAQPLIPLRWNEFFYTNVYHYRTMRRLNPGQTRVKLFILFFEELTLSEIVLKVTSKDKFLGEVPLQRSSYIQDKYTNFMGSCELDIKHEGQFVVVKRYLAVQLRKNNEGILTCDKYNNFLIDLPQGAIPHPPKDWHNTRHDRALKEKERFEEAAQQQREAKLVIDYLQEFYEQTYTEKESEDKPKSPPAENERKVSSVKLEKGVASNTTVQNGGAEEDKPDSLTARPSGEPTIIEELLEVPLEPMLEAHEPDDCTDFYYISRGWGLYLTVMRANPLSILLDSTAMEKVPIRCTTNFYLLSHTAEQNPQKDCLMQIPKTDDFTTVGTVLVFARKAVAPQNENPDPDDSPQEHMLSDDMKTTWGMFWQNQERDRWALLPTGISNKRSRVIFKTRSFTAFIVVQLTSGDERSEREEEDNSSSDEEEVVAGSGEEEEEGEKEEKMHSELKQEEESTEHDRESKKKSRRKSKHGKSFSSSLYGLQDTICLPDEPESDEINSEQEEGEGEEEGEDKPYEDGGETGEATEGAEETAEPGAPAPSPMVNKEENVKDENASNRRQWSPEADRSGNNSSPQRHVASDNKNNNQIKDDSFDQSTLPPEERTIIAGLPPAASEYAKLSLAPSVFRPAPQTAVEGEESPEKTDVAEDSTTEMKSSNPTGDASITPATAMDEPSGDQAAGSKNLLEIQEEEVESEEDLPNIISKKLSITVMKKGVTELQGFKFGPKLSNMTLVGVDMDHVKTNIALMWRFRNHRDTCVLIFARPRGENEFDMVIDVVQSIETYVRAESHYSVGYKMVGESYPIPIKTGRFLSFTIDGHLLVEKCEGGVPSTNGNLRTRTMYFSHSKINSIEYIVKRPQVEEVKGPTGRKGKKKEEVKVDTEPDARLEVMGINVGSATNGVDLAIMPIWLTGPDLWQDRHVHLRSSDNKLLSLLIECLTKSRALERNWWRLVILLGYSEKDVEKEKGKTAPKLVVAMYINKWFEDCLNQHDRGILHLIQCLHKLELDIAIDNVVRILKIYKAHLLNEPERPRYLKLLFHWVLQTKITRNNLLKSTDPPILRPVSDLFLLHLSNFLPKQHLFKIGAAMEVEENVLHAIAGEDIITDEAYVGFRVLIKSRQKKDEIIHYTLLLMEMFKQVELPEADDFMVTETKKWMETVVFTESDICNKLENVFSA